jgi:hypothetical protein
MTAHWRLGATAIACTGMLGAAYAAELNPAAVSYTLPEQTILLIMGEGPATSTLAEQK